MATNSNFIVKNGITVGTTNIINSSGAWVGPNSGLVGATGLTGPTGSAGPAGPTGKQIIQQQQLQIDKLLSLTASK